MRQILVLVSCLFTLGLSAAGVINVAPAFPRAGQPVTFTLTGVSPILSVAWSFGDDSPGTGITTAHTYAEARRYHVLANYTLTSSAGVAETWVTVGAPFGRGPNAPFNLASLVLRWQDGQSSVSVPKDSTSLMAYADIKFEGTGLLQAQWLVDGQVMKTVTQAMSFAGKTTIDSSTMPAFPTGIPGPHDVTLRILNPAVNFRLPVIRYVVSLTAAQPPPPMVESVTPPSAYAGEEVELQVTGQNFTPEMNLDFGSGITLVSPITVLSATSAKVKVFVPPTAKVGVHSLTMLQGKNRLPSKARLEVKARAQVKLATGNFMPCPDQQTFKKAVVKLESPAWEGKHSGENQTKDVAPLLTDFTVFSWTEPQKGAAEYFELRVYDKTGTTLLLTQRLPGNTQRWDTSASFVPKLVDLFRAQPSGAANTQTQPNGTTTPVKSGTVPQIKTADAIAAEPDVLWQIVGLRDYTCLPQKDISSSQATTVVRTTGPGGAPQPKTLDAKSQKPGTTPEVLGQPSTGTEAALEPVKMALEVEASAFWPLKLPEPATGIGQCGVTHGSLQVQSVAGNQDGNNYPGDEFQISGSFSLAGAPYGFQPTSVGYDGKSTDNHYPSVNRCTFDNLFLDWGDGTPIVSLSPRVEVPAEGNNLQVGSKDVFTLPAPPPKQASAPVGSGLSLNLPALLYSASGLSHRYAKIGDYNVRVFMLSEDDVQKAGLKSGAAQVLAAKGTEETDFLKLVKVATGTTGAVPALSHGGSVIIGGMPVANKDIPMLVQQVSRIPIDQVLSRAYLLYCGTKKVVPFPDPCANMPLELVGLSVWFGGGDGYWPSVSGKVDAVTTACNEGFTVRTRLRYRGHGSAKIVWKVNGEPVADTTTNLSTEARKGLTKADSQNADCSKVMPAEQEITLPNYLPTTTMGEFIVTAEATVVTEAGQIDISGAARDLSALGKGGTQELSASTLALLKPGKTTPPKVGILNPNPAPGLPQVVYISDVKQALLEKVDGVGKAGPIATTKMPILTFRPKPPSTVTANKLTYRVDALDPKEPCSLDFPTKNGSFRITDLGSGNAKREVVGGVTRINGKGLIKVAFRAGEDFAVEPAALPIQLTQWEVDGSEVTKGGINLTGLKKPILLPGTKGTLDSLKVSVQGKGKTEDLLVHLTLSPADASLILSGTENTVPVWEVKDKPLSSEGDLYVENLALPTTRLGTTPWTMGTKDGVVLDYSHKQGEGPTGQGLNWVGVRLKRLALTPFAFDLVGASSPLPLVDTWYLGKGQGADGVHGSVSFKNWEAKLQDGSIKVGSMDFDALGDQNYKANYVGTEVKVPWFASPLKGDVTMSKIGNGFLFAYKNVKAASMPMVVDGGFSLTPENLVFASEKNVGWTVMGDAKLAFKADGKPFAAFKLDRFCYRFDGRASFEQNLGSKTVSLNQKSSLGETPADLRDVSITMPGSGPRVVDFAFHTNLHLSASPLLAASDTVVRYQLNRTGLATYAAPPAATMPFEMPMAFPMGSPTIQGKIHPVYAPGGSGTRYTGEVDLGMFGGPPFKTQFVLGYQGGKDYFLCRADIPLGPSGVVLYPELLTLYKIHGGMGYNFGVDAFKDNVSILNAQPDMKGKALFSAGMRVGSADSFAYMLDGTLTISTGAAARMDYDAWLLSIDHSGQGQFKGWFQYGNSSFDGKMWGGLNLLGGLVQFSLGNSEANAAVDLHLASDSWHIYAGQRNGSRIKAKVISSESDSYLMLGSKEGLAIGGAQNYYLGVGDSSVASAYAKAYLDVGLQVTPQPKIIGDFGAGMSAGVCVFGVCVDGGVDAAVHAEALPLKMGATCTLDLGWYLGGDYSFHVNM